MSGRCIHGSIAVCEWCEADARLDMVCQAMELDHEKARPEEIREALSALMQKSEEAVDLAKALDSDDLWRRRLAARELLVIGASVEE